MTKEQISQMIEKTGIKSAYYQFPENPNEPIEPPFICFFLDSSDDLYADNENYQSIENLIVELYSQYKDYKCEKVVENVLKENGLTWTREETSLDDEKLYEVIFRTQILFEKE